MHTFARLGLVATLLVALLAIGVSPGRAAGAVACRTFPETGFTVCDPFLAYWLANGGLAQQGYPLTNAFMETNPTDGKSYLTQYFERARFELHPENAPPYDVLLGLLGNEQFFPKYPTTLPPITGDPFAGDTGGRACERFAQTGETVCGPFLAYWRANGGLAQQGLPISQVFLETNPTNGKQYPTQYFERARFEYHRENANTANAVLLGLLGREQLLAKYPQGNPGTAPGPGRTPVSVAPASGPVGTQFTLTATDLPARATIALSIFRDGNTTPSTREYTLTAGVSILAVTLYSARFAPGTYRVLLGVKGEPASGAATFVVTGEAQQLAVAVTPASGPPGTVFLARATGLPAGATIEVRSGRADGTFSVGTRVRLRPDQTVYEQALGGPDQEPRAYAFFVTTPDGREFSAPYVVTPPPAPAPDLTGPLDVSVSPQIGPPGTSFVVRAASFAPGTTIRVEFIRGDRVLLGVSDTLKPDQTIYFTSFLTDSADPDSYAFRITAPDGRTGTARLFVTHTVP